MKISIKDIIIIILIVIIVILSFVSLDVNQGPTELGEEIDLDAIQIEKIKELSDISELKVSVSEIECDEEECWASIHQEGVINTEWRGPKSHCLDQGPDCVMVDYTPQENQVAIQEYIKQKLEKWIAAEEIRSNVDN